VVGLAFGYRFNAVQLFELGTLAAIIQVVVMRLAFFALRLERGIPYGAAWGAMIAGVIIVGERFVFPMLHAHFLTWFLTAVYIGPPVGGFLSYFYRDDRKIEATTPVGEAVDYGRDAHWLEPFAYGGGAYLLVALPRTVDFGLAVLVVGAMVGVVAAGVSHFILFAKTRSTLLPFAIGLTAGALVGAASGLLFREYAPLLWAKPAVVGALCGAATFVVTNIRGRYLAAREVDEPAEVAVAGGAR